MHFILHFFENAYTKVSIRLNEADIIEATIQGTASHSYHYRYNYAIPGHMHNCKRIRELLSKLPNHLKLKLDKITAMGRNS